jgi:hypothetical protein
LSPLSFPDLICLGSSDLVLLSLLDGVILCLNDSRVLILAIENTINNDILGTLICGFIFFKEMNDLAEQPWHNFFFNSSVVWSNKNSHS